MDRRKLLKLAVASPLMLLPHDGFEEDIDALADLDDDEDGDNECDEAEKHWHKILETVKFQIRPYLYENYLRPAQVLSGFDNTIYVSLPHIRATEVTWWKEEYIELARQKVCPDWTLSLYAAYEMESANGWHAHITHTLTKGPQKKKSLGEFNRGLRE